MKPQRNFWGIAGIVLFFFVPELVTYIWQDELVSWAHLHAITEPFAPIRKMYAMLEEMFRDGVSWVNVGLGVLFLWWAFSSR